MSGEEIRNLVFSLALFVGAPLGVLCRWDLGNLPQVLTGLGLGAMFLLGVALWGFLCALVLGLPPFERGR